MPVGCFTMLLVLDVPGDVRAAPGPGSGPSQTRRLMATRSSTGAEPRSKGANLARRNAQLRRETSSRVIHITRTSGADTSERCRFDRIAAPGPLMRSNSSTSTISSLSTNWAPFPGETGQSSPQTTSGQRLKVARRHAPGHVSRVIQKYKELEQSPTQATKDAVTARRSLRSIGSCTYDSFAPSMWYTKQKKPTAAKPPRRSF